VFEDKAFRKISGVMKDEESEQFRSAIMNKLTYAGHYYCMMEKSIRL
jgi:hypothetical protein